ncbi:MAG: filamentous hemagglutinin N-terminal domain-containing protein, partial [Pseudomonas sp.]|uniref:two-partner secretion domain-containing protein n=1 Tax=Pseudomonas sp. TaxID=306 RepID=UPI0030F0F2D0
MDRHKLALNFRLSARPQHPFLPRSGSALKPALTVLVLLASSPALAEIKVDAAAAASQQTSVGQSERGVPVINIANPDSNGLSHNRFELFHVDKPGVVFNNSLAAGVSQLGGALSANANLSRRAQVILNEVTGNQPSTLAGALEVFGGKADVIVANTLSNSLTASTFAFGNLGLDIGATFSNAGYLAAQGFAAIVAQDMQIKSGARLLFAGGATLAARASLATQDHSSLYSSADLTINAGVDLNTAGDIRSKGKLIMHADQALDNTGNIVSDMDIDLSSKLMMKNDAGGLIYAMGSLM